MKNGPGRSVVNVCFIGGIFLLFPNLGGGRSPGLPPPNTAAIPPSVLHEERLTHARGWRESNPLPVPRQDTALPMSYSPTSGPV